MMGEACALGAVRRNKQQDVAPRDIVVDHLLFFSLKRAQCKRLLTEKTSVDWVRDDQNRRRGGQFDAK